MFGCVAYCFVLDMCVISLHLSSLYPAVARLQNVPHANKSET